MAQGPFLTLRWPQLVSYLEFKVTLNEGSCPGTNTWVSQVRMKSMKALLSYCAHKLKCTATAWQI